MDLFHILSVINDSFCFENTIYINLKIPNYVKMATNIKNVVLFTQLFILNLNNCAEKRENIQFLQVIPVTRFQNDCSLYLLFLFNHNARNICVHLYWNDLLYRYGGTHRIPFSGIFPTFSKIIQPFQNENISLFESW